MNFNNIPVNSAVSLARFMVFISAKLTDTFRCENTKYNVLDLKSHYQGLKYFHVTLKILPQKTAPIVFDQIPQRVGAIGDIHHTQQELNPG